MTLIKRVVVINHLKGGKTFGRTLLKTMGHYLQNRNYGIPGYIKSKRQFWDAL